MRITQATPPRKGFTIVELLIVVVVITILVAITVIAYNGITGQAHQATADSAASSARKKLQLYSVENGDTPPSSLTQAGLQNSETTQYRYSSAGQEFCITAMTGGKQAHITQNGSVQSGFCPGHEYDEAVGLVANPVGKNSTEGWEAAGYGEGDSDETPLPIQTIHGETPINGVSSYIRVSTASAIQATKRRPTSENAYANMSIAYIHELPMPSAIKNRLSMVACVRINTPSPVSTSRITAQWSVDAASYGGPYIGLANNQNNQWQCHNQTTQTYPQEGRKFTRAELYPLLQNTNAPIPAGTTIDFTGVQLYNTNTPITTYKDGDSPAWIWNGTPHASTATGPAT